MGDSYGFAVDEFQTVFGRLAGKAADLRAIVDTTSSIEEWLNWKAFLACRLRQESYPFCEVAAKPAYASEGGNRNRKVSEQVSWKNDLDASPSASKTSQGEPTRMRPGTT